MQSLFDAATKQVGPESLSTPEEALGDRFIGRRVGNYVVDRPLARGGMGSVYVAKHPHLGREVAVKFLGQDLSSEPELAARFLAEARVTASLSHPNVVEILDFGELDGAPYYVMELLRGKSLRVVMREHGRLSGAAMRPYVEQICWALDAAHRAGIVHRDLKPANVLVLEGTPLRLKLLDFGVAKLMSSGPTQTRHGQVLGTATHMAPEQALGDARLVTPQSDLYSLGAIAYEMLTGKPVFNHESDVMLMVMHVRDAVPPIREQVPDVPDGVAKLVERLLAKIPADRPQGARLVAEELGRALEQPELARPALEPPAAPAPNRAAMAEQPTRVGSLPPVAAEAPATATALGDRPTRLASIPAPPVAARSPAAAAERPTRVAEPPPTRVAEPPPAPAVERKTRLAEPTPQLSSPPAPAVAPEPRRATPPAGIPTQISPQAPAAPAARRATPLGTPRVELHRPLPPAVATLVSPPAPIAIRQAPPPESTPAAESTIQTLLSRLQRRGDFPAFARTIGEVSHKADAEGTFSAGQLGESILKDYALTSKLLRIVNATYARRFGGRIYSVQHAIVILGFDRVRSLALSISLFKTSGTGKDSSRVSESAISALVSSEIARNLAGNARVNDDQATVCAMFRNLGRHLVLVYLPELYDTVHVTVERDGLPVVAAARRVLGLSFEELGAAIAKSWQLPPQVVNAMSLQELPDGPIERNEDRLNGLAGFSNELCDIVTREPPETRERSILKLLKRHRHLIGIDGDALAEILAHIESSLNERYAALLGADLKSSRFVMNASLPPAATTGRPESRHGAGPGERKPHVGGFFAAAKLRAAKPEHRQGRAATDPAAATQTAALLAQRIAELKQALERGQPTETVLGATLRIASEHLSLRAPLVLIAAANRQNLIVRFGLHDDLEGLKRELKFTLRTAGSRTNVFASAYHAGKDCVVKDCFEKESAELMPPSYFEILGSPALAIYPCLAKGTTPALLVLEADSARGLPPPARVAELAELRPLIARAAARS